MKKTLIVVGAVVFLAGLGLYAKTQMELSYKLQYNYKNFRLKYASAEKVVVDFDLLIQNTDALEIIVKKIDIDVYSNEVYVTRIYTNEDLIIKPNGETSVPMQIILNPKTIVTNINQLAFGAASLNDMRLKFKGKLVVKKLGMGIPIPFVYSTTYKELMGT